MNSRTEITAILAGQLVRPPQGRPRSKPCKRAPSATYWFERGSAADLDGEVAHARYCYHRAISQRPEYAQAHNQLGRIAHELATVTMQASASTDATLAAAVDRYAQLSIAEAHYRLALCSAPTEGIYWFNLGLVLELRGSWSLAIAAFEAALLHDATLHQAHLQLAELYQQRCRAGDPDAARLAIQHLGAARRM
ncbi:MAG: hypothetical protein KBG15_03560 [Kofleriaceae bacterium]|nr:hypothetical protein [Kofleriaceae bacterium]